MKRILLGVFCLALPLVLVGCGGGGVEKPKGVTTDDGKNTKGVPPVTLPTAPTGK